MTNPRNNEHSVFTWHALQSHNGEMAAPAAQRANVEKVVRDVYRVYLDRHVRRHGWRGERAGTDGLGVRAAQEQFAEFYGDAVIVTVESETEAQGFGAWLNMCRLTPPEALLRWRLGIPWEGEGEDPLIDEFEIDRALLVDEDDGEGEGGCAHAAA